MGNEIKTAAPSALAISEEELLSVLCSSLYPGAKVESAKMVLQYCRASQLDPMQKPVHIVPMLVSTGRKDGEGWDIKEMRDVVMPGIGLYRTQAARSGLYGGISEPEYGEDVTQELGGTRITYPKWCKVTVKRILPSGVLTEFTAKELWTENYATKGSKSTAPNSMWARRPYAQLAKCAEAQALRKAFPEIGSQPTAEEMEGKSYGDERDVSPSAKPNTQPETTQSYVVVDPVKIKALQAAAESGDSSRLSTAWGETLTRDDRKSLGTPYLEGLKATCENAAFAKVIDGACTKVAE